MGCMYYILDIISNELPYLHRRGEIKRKQNCLALDQTISFLSLDDLAILFCRGPAAKLDRRVPVDRSGRPELLSVSDNMLAGTEFLRRRPWRAPSLSTA